jgi:hypothetical protein
MTSITITGLDKVEKMLSPARFEQACSRSLDRASQIWRDETKQLPPVSASRTGYGAKGIPVAPLYGGTLRQLIQARRVSNTVAEVYSGAKYSSYVYNGVKPFQMNRAVNIPGVGWRYIKTHPGMPARPFFEWSLELGAREKIIVEVTRQFTHALNG